MSLKCDILFINGALRLQKNSGIQLSNTEQIQNSQRQICKMCRPDPMGYINKGRGILKIYLSWSGTLSKQVAELFAKYLSMASPSFDVWSSQSIEAGMNWNSQIVDALKSCDAILMFVTHNNSSWMMFEAGMAHSLGKLLIPITVGVTPSDLTGPIAQFQSVNIESSAAINNLIQMLLDKNDESYDSRLNSIHKWETSYSSLQSELNSLLKKDEAEKTLRNKDIIRATDAFDKAWGKKQ
jgi:hypothetical protein